MSDIEFYEKWCEYNENNLPISFAEFCYKQGKADGAREFAEWFKKSNYYLCFSDTIDEVLAEWQKGKEE